MGPRKLTLKGRRQGDMSKQEITYKYNESPVNPPSENLHELILHKVSSIKSNYDHNCFFLRNTRSYSLI